MDLIDRLSPNIVLKFKFIQFRAAAPLAILYNTSTLENHHYDTCLRISSMDGNNIFESFSNKEFDDSCEIMKHAILATDLALYFQ